LISFYGEYPVGSSSEQGYIREGGVFQLVPQSQFFGLIVFNSDLAFAFDTW
jgi:hypothetical protein